MRLSSFLLLWAFVFGGAIVSAHEEHHHGDHAGHDHGHSGSDDPWNIGGFLYPNLHLHSTMGATSRSVSPWAAGGHDPTRQAFSAQAIEPGLTLRSEVLEGFASFMLHQGHEGEWDSDWESAFLTVPRLPGGFAVTAGQFLAAFGSVNHLHLHDWDFVDSELSSGAFLGDHGLLLRGAEVAWDLPLAGASDWHARLSLSHGSMRPHSHHAHDHDVDHLAPHALHEGEDATLTRNVWVGRLGSSFRIDDQRSLTGGYSVAFGDNGFDRSTRVHALDLEFRWREASGDSDRRSVRWKNELTWRQVGALSAHDDDDDGVVDAVYRGRYHEWAAFSQAVVTWNPHWDTAMRVGWLEGIPDFDQPARVRLSPAVTWWLGAERRMAVRAQYNYDLISAEPDIHAFWLQFSITLGSRAEIR